MAALTKPGVPCKCSKAPLVPTIYSKLTTFRPWNKYTTGGWDAVYGGAAQVA
jgi:hypothetical protein